MKHCNLDYLKSFTPNDDAFAIQVLEVFLQEMPSSVAQMKEALKTSDWHSLHMAAHRVKPSVQLVGVPSGIMESLVKIVTISKHETGTSELPGLVAGFDRALTEIYPELRDALNEMKA